MYRGSSLVLFKPQTGFPGLSPSSPKASNPLPDKPSQEAAGEKENWENAVGNSISPGLQLVPVWRPPDMEGS